MKIVVAAALLLSSLAQAQPVPQVLPLSSFPSCWPAQVLGVPLPFGKGTQLYSGAVGEIGDWYGWRCPGGGTVLKWVRKAYKGPSATMLINEAFQMPSMEAAARVLWSKYDAPLANCDLASPGPTEACKAESEQIIAAGRSALALVQYPGQAQWIVAKNAALLTRPAYWVAADALLPTQPALRATVGAECDCTKPFLKTTSTYCNVPPLPATVYALCVRK